MSIVKNYQITAKLAEFGEWETVDQPELVVTIDEYYAPGANTPRKLVSIGKFDDIMIGRAYDPSKDGPVEAWVKRFLNGTDTSRNLTIFVFNDQKAIQATKTFKVYPIGPKAPSGKSGDGGISEFTLKLAVEEQV